MRRSEFRQVHIQVVVALSPAGPLVEFFRGRFGPLDPVEMTVQKRAVRSMAIPPLRSSTGSLVHRTAMQDRASEWPTPRTQGYTSSEIPCGNVHTQWRQPTFSSQRCSGEHRNVSIKSVELNRFAGLKLHDQIFHREGRERFLCQLQRAMPKMNFASQE
jgi:hypothetical protein